MTAMNIVVLDGYTLHPGDLSWDALAALGRLTVYDRTAADRIVERAMEAEAVITNKTPLRRETIAALPRLRYIGVLATGYDVVDIAAAAERGVPVTNIPAYGTASVAQFAFGLLLELCHRIGLHDRAVKDGEWSRSEDFCFWRTPQTELAGKTFGIVGLGRIGLETARLAQAFGMRVVVHTRRPESVPADADLAWRDLDALLAESDVVSLHCPLTPETAGLVNERFIGRMKRSAFLLNTSRGKLVDEAALAAALTEGRLAGAAVDVLSAEPPPPGHPLLRAPNCIVTPHIAWASKEARQRLMDMAVGNVRGFLEGRPVNVVNDSLL